MMKLLHEGFILFMVAPAGLEPARPYGQQILSLQRLPFRHGALTGWMISIIFIKLNAGG
jgi:hypothetical protein